MSPAPDQVERFRGDVARLTGGEPGFLGIAVSGGPDSLALLLLAGAAYPGKVRAATVDHGLRPESASEAEYVARVCADLAIPHASLRADVDASRSSLQRAAREARYRALQDWAEDSSIPFLATAHHVEDQAETLLMRLLRGSGTAGLAGIRASGRLAGATVIRPLLGWSRAELAQVVESHGLVAVQDPSNADERFDRARVRRLLAECAWLDPEPLAHSAAALAQAEEALAWAAERLWGERAVRDAEKISLDPRAVPAELLRRLLMRAVQSLSPEAELRGEEVQRLADTLARGGSGTLAGVLARGGESWTFEAAPPRRR